jgi:heat shock protein HslJ
MSRTHRTPLCIAAAMILASALCSCAMTKKEPPPKPFTATKWQLVMDIPPPGERPYVRFGDGRMEGFGGCDKFTARYVQDSVGARAIAIGRIDVDRRLCDASLRMGEARMLEVLQSVSSYSVTMDTLTMSGSGGTLKFRAADESLPLAGADATQAPASTPSVASASPTLAGTRWKGVVDAGVDEAATPWLEFVEGRVAGYTGCNMLSGTWRMDGSQVRLGPLATTKRACAGAGGEVENRVLSIMNERARVTREGGLLVATTPEGARLEFSEVR